MSISPSDTIYLPFSTWPKIVTRFIATVKSLPGIFRMTHDPGQQRDIAELLLLDGNTAIADADLDTRGFLPLLVELITEDRGRDGEHADNEVKNVAIHCHCPGVHFFR
jgi:hypothetical protein